MLLMLVQCPVQTAVLDHIPTHLVNQAALYVLVEPFLRMALQAAFNASWEHIQQMALLLVHIVVLEHSPRRQVPLPVKTAALEHTLSWQLQAQISPWLAAPTSKIPVLHPSRLHLKATRPLLPTMDRMT
jgi:hypothetical protein